MRGSYNGQTRATSTPRIQTGRKIINRIMNDRTEIKPPGRHRSGN
jgi:hypothetical protein